MKKLLFLLAIATTALSCKHQNDVTPIKKNATLGKSRTLAGGDGKYDVLGYGIDITLDDRDPNSVSLSPIIDAPRFATDYASQLSSYIDQDDATAQIDSFYYGSNAVTYSMELTKSKGLSVSANQGKTSTSNNSPSTAPSGGSITGNTGNEKVEGASSASANNASTAATNTPGNSATTSSGLFTASYSKNTTDQTTNGFSNKYSYASEEVKLKVRRLAFTGDVTVNMLMNYLTPAFINDVNTLSPDDLVARYGTHVLLDISLGGVLKFHYSTITADQTNITNNTSDLKIGLGATIFKTVGINVNYTASTAQVTSVMNSSLDKLYTMQYFGGSTSGQTVSFDINGNPSQTINLGSWESSINVNNCAIVDIGNALYIYDFISDPAKKAAVMAAVQRHIAAAQVTVITPIISTWYPNTTIFSARGQVAYSQNKQYELTLAGDGNLDLINRSTGVALWATNKYDSNGGGANSVVMQADGNLVANSSTGSVVWAANFYWANANLTNSTTIFYTLQNDGNLVLYSNGKAVAATQTNGGQKSTHFGTLK